MEKKDLHMPEQWEDWTVDELIGVGAYGKVFRIYKEDFPEEVRALKVVSIPPEDETEFLFREFVDVNSRRAYLSDLVSDYRKEIELLEALKDCPYVVHIYEYEIVENPNTLSWTIYIMMEMLTPLDTYSLGEELGEQDVRNIGEDICSALIECEKLHILHRDIKPANIFIDANGKYKLGDFGIARLVDRTEGTLSQKGTFTFMAPEVYKGKKYGKQADIYSLGIVLYKLLNHNRDPFLPQNKLIYYRDREEALSRRMKGEKLPVIEGVSPAFMQVVLCACEYHPQNRFSDAAAMKKELQQTETRKKWKPAWLTRRYMIRGAVVCMVALIVAGVIFAVYDHNRKMSYGEKADTQLTAKASEGISSVDMLISKAMTDVKSDDADFEKLFINTDQETMQNYTDCFMAAAKYEKFVSKEISEVDETVFCSVVAYDTEYDAGGRVKKYAFPIYATHNDDGWFFDNDQGRKEKVYSQSLNRGIYPSGMTNNNGNAIRFDPYNLLYIDEDKVFEDVFAVQVLYMWQDSTGKVSIMVWYANGTEREIKVSNIHILFNDKELGPVADFTGDLNELITPQKSIYKIYEINADDVFTGTSEWSEVSPVMQKGDLTWTYNS